MLAALPTRMIARQKLFQRCLFIRIVAGLFDHRRAATFLAQAVNGSKTGDAQEPAREATPPGVVTLAALPQLHEDVLGHFFRQTHVLEDAPSHAVHQVGVTLVKNQEGVAIAGSDALQ